MADRTGFELEQRQRVVGSGSLLRSDGTRIYALDLPKGPAKPVEIMNRKVEQYASGPGMVHEPLAGSLRGDSPSPNASDGRIAQITALDDPVSLGKLREEPNHLSRHEGDPRVTSRPHEFPALFQGASEGLFHEDGLAGADRPQPKFEMEVGGQAYVDHVRRRDEVVFGGHRIRSPPLRKLPRLLGVRLKKRNLDVRHELVLGSVDVTHPPCAENPHSHGASLSQHAQATRRLAHNRTMIWVLGFAIGAAAGVLSGLFGIGGGVLIVPGLIYLLGFGQAKAQGTSLAALVLPVGLLGLVNYYKQGQADVKLGLLVAVGLFGGAYVGSKFALNMDESLLRRSFAVLLVLVALQLFFKK